MFFLKELPTKNMLSAYRERFPTMNVEAVENALRLLRQASLLLRELETYFAAYDLSQLRFLVLVVLDREQDSNGLMASEIAARLDVSRPVATRTLQTLASDGLLQIDTHIGDGRAKQVRLTHAGRQKLNALLPGYYRVIEASMAGSGPQ